MICAEVLAGSIAVSKINCKSAAYKKANVDRVDDILESYAYSWPGGHYV
jgi:hypothetical protein